MALAMLCAGCVGQPSHGLVATSVARAPASEIAASHRIFVATTRAASADAKEVFGSQRPPATHYASVDVTVPKVHKTGTVERPVGKAGDQAKYFTAMRVAGYRDSKAFADALRSDIRTRDGRALVFIHGYNTAFDSAVYRMTQIAHDAGYTGTPILFSWASGGRISDYVYDNNSAHAARDALEDTLRMIARSGVRRIDIVAHSMGNWVTMEALRQLAITGDRDLGGKLGDVVLASPDIDVDVFKAQMRRYGKPDKPFFLLVSRDDRALQLSSLIAGRKPRLGDYDNAADIASYGVTVVDLSRVQATDRLAHTKFADNPLLVRLLGEGLKEDARLGSTERAVTDRINNLAQGLGQTLVSAAEIVITTPVEVLNVVVGQ